MSSKEVTIVKDYWDLKSDRIQVITGLFLAAMAILAVWLFADHDFANSIAHQYSISLINIYGTAQSTFIAKVLAGMDANYLTVPRLLVHISTGFIAGLSALEISKLYGNRWGMVHSVWVALIYIVCPTTVLLIYAGDGLLILLGALFANLAVYLDFRYRSLEEEFYLIASALLLSVAVCFDVVAGLIALAGIMISRLTISKLHGSISSESFKLSYLAILIPVVFIILQNNGLRDGYFSPQGMQNLLTSLASSPEHLIAHSKSLFTLFIVSLAILGTLTALRVIAGTLWIRPLAFLSLWLMASFIIACYYILGATYLSDSSIAVASLIFYCSPPMVILICLTALPAIDAVNKPISILISLCGCFCLSLLLVFWGTQMYKAQKKQVTIQEKFTLYERAAKQEASAYPNRDLVLLGMPREVVDYVKDHKMHLSSKRMTGLFQAVKAERTRGFALINALGFKSTVLDKRDADTRLTRDGTIYLKWRDKTETFAPIKYSGRFNFSMIGDLETARLMKVEPANTPILQDTAFRKLDFDSPFIEYRPDHVKLVANKSPVTLWLPEVKLNPAATNRMKIEGYLSEDSSSSFAKSKNKLPANLVWMQNDDSLCTARLYQKAPGILQADLYRNPEWMSSSYIKKIGIKLEPGQYHMILKRISYER